MIILLVVLLSGAACTRSKTGDQLENQNQNAAPSSVLPSGNIWQDQGVVIPGQFADAEIVALGNGRYRLYYAAEPDSPDFQGQVYSSISSDGINWVKEEGIRKTQAVFFDVIQLPDGRYRAYFQNAQAIKSAISADGLAWTDEPGVRIDQNEAGYNLENVGAQSTFLLPDGTYVMVYRGTINEPYQTAEKIPNSTTQLYFWAVSEDGLNFEKKGLAIDSRNETLYGLADGAEWVTWESGELRLYFWSYAGIYHTAFANEVFSQPVFDWTNNKDSRVKFAPDPPCDPTILKINSRWFMYYGQHSRGIYYATYGEE
ncbi:MAG: hypothetical protein WC497_06160 [Patescibacteria group bacterium]